MYRAPVHPVLLLPVLAVGAAQAAPLRDLAYGPDRAGHIDVYTPRSPVHDAPMIVMEHTGRGRKQGRALGAAPLRCQAPVM